MLWQQPSWIPSAVGQQAPAVMFNATQLGKRLHSVPAATFTLGSKIFGASLYVGAHNSTDQTNPSRVFVHMSIEQFTRLFTIYRGWNPTPVLCGLFRRQWNKDQSGLRGSCHFQDLLWLGSIITAHVLTSPRHPSKTCFLKKWTCFQKKCSSSELYPCHVDPGFS